MEFKKNLWLNNGVISIGFPIDVVKWLDVKNGDAVIIEDKEDKNGKYIIVRQDKK